MVSKLEFDELSSMKALWQRQSAEAQDAAEDSFPILTRRKDRRRFFQDWFWLLVTLLAGLMLL